MRLLTIKEAAEFLRVTERTIHRYIRSELLPANKVGGRWKISEDDVVRLATGKQPSGEE